MGRLVTIGLSATAIYLLRRDIAAAVAAAKESFIKRVVKRDHLKTKIENRIRFLINDSLLQDGALIDQLTDDEKEVVLQRLWSMRSKDLKVLECMVRDTEVSDNKIDEILSKFAGGKKPVSDDIKRPSQS